MSSLKPPNQGEYQATMELAGRKKVTLTPGHSLVDWIKLGRTKGDLSGVPSKKRDMTLEEVAVHNSPNDLWMVLRGKVYNITPYLYFHPGGVDELMRAAGKDGTDLFDEIHNWVNVESMLEKCLVGYLSSNYMPKRQKSKQLQPVRTTSLPSIGADFQPTYDWTQKPESITIVIKPRFVRGVRREHITTDVSSSEVLIASNFGDYTYFVHFEPSFPLKETPKVVVNSDNVEVTFTKVTPKKWTTFGEQLSKDSMFMRTKNLAPRYRQWTVTSNTQVTHDTVLLRLKAPTGYTMIAPVGYHIHIVKDVSGMQIGRSYTIVGPSIISPKSDEEQEAGKAIHVMVKYYKGGVISPSVTAAKEGEIMRISNYDGSFSLSRLDNITQLVMFAAGTGFTSMTRLITHALQDIPDAKFPVKLVFYNKTEKDILWKSQLDKLEKENSRFSCTHVLSKEESSSWKGYKGRVAASHVKEFVTSPSKWANPLVCICGPWAYNDSVESLIKLHGLTDENVFVFTQKL